MAAGGSTLPTHPAIFSLTTAMRREDLATEQELRATSDEGFSVIVREVSLPRAAPGPR